MKIVKGGKVSVVLCLSIFLLLCSLHQPVIHAAGFTYGDYYNNNLTNTTTGNTQAPSINGKGDKIAFWSNTVSLGSNGTSKEIFIWTSPSTITKISSSDPGQGDVDNTLPSINFTGDRVTYIKDTGASTNKFLMLWKSNESTAKIAEAGSGKVIDSCKISGNGTKVVFRGNKDFIGSDTSNEFYLWEDGSGVTTKITSTQSANAPDTAFSITYDGTLVAFTTKENANGDTLLGSNNTDGNYEIYMWDKNAGTTTKISSSGGGIGSIDPSITSYTRPTTTSTTSVTSIAFSSDRNLVANNNSDANLEIFLWTLNGSYTSTNTGSFTQITSTSALSGGDCRNPQISRDGKFVAFTSNIDIISGGTSLLTGGTSAIFVWNSNGVMSQVNTNSSDNPNPVIGSYTGLYESDTIQYGPRIAYFSTADGSQEIYLATSTIPVPATSRWGLIILILLLATLAVFMLRRKKKSAGAAV